MYCPRCGTQNPDGSPQCRQCGCLLTAASTMVGSSPPPPPQATPAGSGIDVIIPYKNSAALTAYYLGVFSLACGALLGVPALILGIIGLKAANANPGAHGKVHAWIGISLGGLMTLVSLAVLVFMMVAVRRA